MIKNNISACLVGLNCIKDVKKKATKAGAAPKNPVGEKNATTTAGNLEDLGFKLIKKATSTACKQSRKTTVEEVEDEGDAPYYQVKSTPSGGNGEFLDGDDAKGLDKELGA